MMSLNKITIHGSAWLNGLAGILISFFPSETGMLLTTSSQSGVDLLVMKIVAAGLFGFGVLNFMSLKHPLGGIYGKSIILSNMIFHLIIGVQCLKFAIGDSTSQIISVAGTLYTLLALGFIKMNFSIPDDH